MPSCRTLKFCFLSPGINSPFLVVTITSTSTSGTFTCRVESGIPSGFLTVRLGGSGGASVFLGTATGLTPPCGPPASGGASCEGGFCLEPVCVLLEEEELGCPRSRELTGRNKNAISRKRTLLAPKAFTSQQLTN